MVCFANARISGMVGGLMGGFGKYIGRGTLVFMHIIVGWGGGHWPPMHPECSPPQICYWISEQVGSDHGTQWMYLLGVLLHPDLCAAWSRICAVHSHLGELFWLVRYYSS